MPARYLIRLDDACHGMARQPWGELERVFDRHGIKPIVAVVPDNQDRELMCDEPDPDFWDRVRGWQAKGWTIGMHGYRHRMHPIPSERLLVPFYRRSEFAGLGYEEQGALIRAAWQIFLTERVRPEVWVAPAHSFDGVTLRAVAAETSIRVVSDGIAWNTFYAHHFHWIPQQMWATFAERRTGLWTLCLHPSAMDDAAIARLDRSIGERFRSRIISFGAVELRRRGKSLLGHAYHQMFWRRWRKTASELSL